MSQNTSIYWFSYVFIIVFKFMILYIDHFKCKIHKYFFIPTMFQAWKLPDKASMYTQVLFESCNQAKNDS